MKKILFVIISLLFTTNVMADPAISKDGYFACKSQAFLRDMVKFVDDSNTYSFNSYLLSGKCFFLKEGLQVTVIERPDAFAQNPDFRMFMVGGTLLWAESEAFDYNV